MTERFKPLSPEQWTDAQRRVAEALTKSPRGAVRGPYVPLIYSPELAGHMLRLGDFIRFGGVLPPRLKEIVIYVVARHWSVEFMFAIHAQMATEQGIDRAIVDTIAHGRRPDALSGQEAAAYDAARELVRTARIGDATYAELRGYFDEGGVIELVAFVGYYTSLAMILNTAQIEPPAGVQRLPPAP
jgi:4-carboxymuconolactone decarboxylase